MQVAASEHTNKQLSDVFTILELHDDNAGLFSQRLNSNLLALSIALANKETILLEEYLATSPRCAEFFALWDRAEKFLHETNPHGAKRDLVERILGKTAIAIAVVLSSLPASSSEIINQV